MYSYGQHSLQSMMIHIYKKKVQKYNLITIILPAFTCQHRNTQDFNEKWQLFEPRTPLPRVFIADIHVVMMGERANVQQRQIEREDNALEEVERIGGVAHRGHEPTFQKKSSR